MITEQKMMIVRETSSEVNRVSTSADIAAVWNNEVKKSSWFQEDKEAFVVFFLNGKNYLTGYNLVTLGLLDASLVHPREVFRPAIIAGAASIVIAHNHPSGDATPSEEDIKVTRQLIAAAQIINIKIMDHVIVGRESGVDKGFYSMRESGNCEFNV
jgi:DNA repair protein RadC